MFRAIGYEREIDNGSRRVETAVALMMGDAAGRVSLVRIHSQCFTGEILGSLRCDCRGQYVFGLGMTYKRGRGRGGWWRTPV
jgi:GTP cyclohydrolase II